MCGQYGRPNVPTLTIVLFLCKLTTLCKAYGEMVEMAEGTGLENRRGCKSSAGSNPALSARFLRLPLWEPYFVGEEANRLDGSALFLTLSIING